MCYLKETFYRFVGPEVNSVYGDDDNNILGL